MVRYRGSSRNHSQTHVAGRVTQAGIRTILMLSFYFTATSCCDTEVSKVNDTTKIDAILTPDENWLNKAGPAVDTVARGVEEFGTGSASNPLLAPPATQPFTFQLSKKADDYYKDARSEIQGRSAVLDQSIQETDAGAKVEANLTSTLGYLSQLQAYGQDLAAFQLKQQLNDASARAQSQQILNSLPANATPEERAAAEEAADKAMATSLSGPTSRPSFPAAPTTSPAADNSTIPSPKTATSTFSSTTFSAVRGLLTGSEPTLSNRDAIETAAGDSVTAAIFSLLSNPKQYTNDFTDKELLVGATMISVNPGWRTKEGYAADISVRVSYDYVPARQQLLQKLFDSLPQDSDLTNGSYDWQLKDLLRKTKRVTEKQSSDGTNHAPPPPTHDPPPTDHKEVPQTKPTTSTFDYFARRPVYLDDITPQAYHRPDLSGNSTLLSQSGPISRLDDAYFDDFNLPVVMPSPLVAATSPMTDSVVLDLSNSIRRQRANALSISAALQYAGLGAQAGAFDQLAKRLEQDVQTRMSQAAISAYSTGGTFGFEIGPRLQAVGDPGGKSTMASEVLDRQTFPALIVIGMDQDDLRVRFGMRNGKVIAFEPVIAFHQETRWHPLDRSTSEQRISETVRMKWAAGLAAVSEMALEHDQDAHFDQARAAIDKLRLGASISPTELDVLRYCRARLVSIETLGGFNLDERKTLDKVIASISDPKKGPLPINSDLSLLNQALLRVSNEISASNSPRTQTTKTIDSYVRQRAEAMEELALGSMNAQMFPVTMLTGGGVTPKTISITPATQIIHAYRDRPSVFLVAGQNLGGLHDAQGKPKPGVHATVGSLGEPSVSVLPLGDGVVAISINPPTDPKNPGMLLPLPKTAEPVTISDGTKTFNSGLVSFDLPLPSPGTFPQIVLTRDSSGRITSLTVEARTPQHSHENVSFTPDQLIQLLTEMNKSTVDSKSNTGGSSEQQYQLSGQINVSTTKPTKQAASKPTK